MFRSREGKVLLKQFLFLLVVILLFSSVFYFVSTKKYEEAILAKEASFASSLIKSYPNDEYKIIEILKDSNLSSKDAKSILDKYGISVDSSSFAHEKSLLFKTYFITLLVVIILITSLYLYSMNNFYKKLDSISDYIKNVLNHKIPLKMKDYYEGSFSNLQDDVYKITNRLIEQHEDVSKDKKYLEETLSDISHQLKTPLTSLYMINNCLRDSDLSSSMKTKFLEENEKQLERIEWLVTSLLKLSRLESGMIKLKREQVKVIHLLEEAISVLAIPIELKHQACRYKGKMDVMVRCDFKWTIESLVNIIKNAHEHTPTGGIITFMWQDNPLYVSITIQDTGEGIEEIDLPHVFERFYKGSHNSKESIGIGLNMAKQIIEREQGDISVISEVGKGTTFIIKFFKTKND
ncbi:MAG: HAMP domain-containing sensor histidine kinase [Bacilli bacterium]